MQPWTGNGAFLCQTVATTYKLSIVSNSWDFKNVWLKADTPTSCLGERVYDAATAAEGKRALMHYTAVFKIILCIYHDLTAMFLR